MDAPKKRAMRLGRLVLALTCVGAGASSAQSGKLEDVREEVRDGDGEPPEPWHEESFADAGDEGWFEIQFSDALDVIVQFTVLLPFFLPRQALGDRDLEPGRFMEYPHQEGPGYWLDRDDAPWARSWSFRPRAELARDFDDLERVGLALQVEHASRFGLDASWNRWREDLDAAGTDELDLADANLVYRFAQGGHGAFRAGLGVNYLNDALDEEWGVNSTYGADFLVGRHASLALEGDLGTLGDATQTHARATLGLLIERFEIYASADYTEIDDEDLRSYGVGLRAWF